MVFVTGEPVVELLAEASPWPLAAVQVLEEGVAILPVDLEGDRGVYRSETDILAKSLRAEGVQAWYVHSEGDRSWLALKGAVELAFGVAIAASIIGAAAWDGLKAGFRRWARTLEPGQHLKLDVRVVDGDRSTSVRISGDAEAVVDALDRIPDVLSTEGGNGDGSEQDGDS